MSDQRIVLNGINALTGEYLVPPMGLPEAAAHARGTPPPREQEGFLRRMLARATGKFFGLPMDIDATELKEAGWCIVFPSDTPAAVRKALQPLIDLRSKQAPPDRCKVLQYKTGESKEEWLGKYGAHAADIEPTRVPYYVLLVGGPESIPFEFQFLLDIDYAVGRIAFDKPADYGRYAQAVVDYETGKKVTNKREVVYWGTRHDSDEATHLSADSMVSPLFKGIPASNGSAAVPAIATKMKFKSRCLLAEEATKANLLETLHSGGKAAPSLLFTASHGMGGWPKGDERQKTTSGALLCQDWEGFGRIKPAHYLAASEVESDANLGGMVAFLFACYGAGTPRFDPFLRDLAGGPVQVAEASFISALAQRLLSRGALAVVGHVERAWGYSIQPPGVGAQLLPFRNFLGRVMAGDPVGHATMDFSQRYAACSADLLAKLDPSLPAAQRPTDAALAGAWVERNDAQNYVVIGDPAVHLRVDELK